MKIQFDKILPYLKNKYILATIVFLVLILFFDRNNLFLQYERQRDYNALLKNKDFYVKEIDSTKAELQKLRSNPKALQKYARENLFMSKDSEDIYIIDRGQNTDAGEK